MKRVTSYLILLLFIILTGCNNKDLANNAMVSITRHPEPYNLNIERLSELSHFDKDYLKGKGIDLRGKDLSELSLKNRADDLIYSQFNMSTKWPSELAEDFNPKIMIEQLNGSSMCSPL